MEEEAAEPVGTASQGGRCVGGGGGVLACDLRTDTNSALCGGCMSTITTPTSSPPPHLYLYDFGLPSVVSVREDLTVIVIECDLLI